MELVKLACAAVLISAFALPATGQDELAFEEARFGLRVRRPSADWTWYATDAAGEALYALAIFPKGSQGVPGWTLYVSAAQGAKDPEVALAPARAKLAELGATEFERTTARLAGRDAPTLTTRVVLPSGVEVEVRASFVIAHDRLYAAQAVRAPNDTASVAALDALGASLELFEPTASASTPATDPALLRLAARCGEELGWASSWKDAAERARREHKVVLVLVENYAALGLPATARSGPFVDPDFAALVAAHCVPWAMGIHDDAPFRAPGAYGISESAWGTALLFVEPGGDVLAEAAHVDATYLDAFFRAEVLPRIPPAQNEPDSDPLGGAERAAQRGDFARARKLVGDGRSPRALRVLATLARRDRKAEEALDLLREARKSAPADLEPELAADQAWIELRAARFDEARADYERVSKSWPAHPRAEEALFWLGALRVLAPDDELAPEEWRTLVAEHPESRWAAKAAANLARVGRFVLGGERPDWPPAELLACTLPLARSPMLPKAHERARDDALAWLVEHQRDDGSWWAPMDAFGVGSNLYSTATSALAATALLPHVAEPGARKAVERALAHVLAAVERGELDAGTGSAGAYGVWNRTFAAWLCARSLTAEFGDKARLVRALARLVPALEASQHRGGGYPYVYFPGDPAGEGFDPSASFLTAGVALVLADVRAAGASVSDERLGRALDFLEALRDSDGTFRYMRDIAGRRESGVAREACGRGPVCVLALRRNGRSDEKELTRVLELFAAHRDVYAPEWRKALCHTSPTGFGAHYLLYDYAFAARALDGVTGKERLRFRAALLEDLLAERLADGSFEDLPGLGRAYGTAAALLALDALAAR